MYSPFINIKLTLTSELSIAAWFRRNDRNNKMVQHFSNKSMFTKLLNFRLLIRVGLGYDLKIIGAVK